MDWQNVVLTLDNSLLSRPTLGDLEGRISGDVEPSTIVREYVRDSISDNTKRAYRSDLQHFLDWGGAIPALDVTLADYLAQYAGKLSVATLIRRIASISKAHSAKGLRNPARSELVKSTLRGIKRVHGQPQRRAKPLTKEDLFSVLAVMGDSLKDVRDKALLMVGFAGGFRRSELTAINFTDIETVRQGMVIHVRRSKTDQEGVGRNVGIPHGRTRWCPVMALNDWLERAGIEDGPVFRPVDRHGNLLDGRLSGEAVSLVIKERVAAVGLEPNEFSGHSLRAGLATSAAAAGVSSWKIRQQTGHASDAMLARYIREGELFIDNAAGMLL
jgi:integrase